MGINGIDPSAKTPPRVRRNWNRGSKGSFTGSLNLVNPITLDAQNRLTLDIGTNGGLDPSSAALQLKLDGTSLTTSSAGVKVNALGIATSMIQDDAVNKDKLGILTTKGDLLGFSTEPVRIPVGANGLVMTADSTAAGGVSWQAGGGGGGSGTVTSVGLSAPSIFTVSVSPVTTSGTLTFVLATETANKVFAGPTTGSAAAPTFRSLVAADVPSLSYLPLSGGNMTSGGSNLNLNTKRLQFDNSGAEMYGSGFGVVNIDRLSQLVLQCDVYTVFGFHVLGDDGSGSTADLETFVAGDGAGNYVYTLANEDPGITTFIVEYTNPVYILAAGVINQLVPGVHAVTGTTLIPLAGYNVNDMAAANAATTIAAPDTTAPPFSPPLVPDGQELILRFRNTTNVVFTWNSIYAFSTQFPSASIPATNGAKFEVRFRYNSTDNKWRCIGIVTGF